MKNDLPDKQSSFLLYTGNDGRVNVEVFLKDETVWLTQKAIGKLEMDSTVRNFRTVRQHGLKPILRNYYQSSLWD